MRTHDEEGCCCVLSLGEEEATSSHINAHITLSEAALEPGSLYTGTPPHRPAQLPSPLALLPCRNALVTTDVDI